VECARNRQNGIARVCRVITALWGLNGLSQGRERGVGVCSARPSGEAGGLECMEEKGKEGPKRRLWMVGDRRWQWPESGGCGWRSGGAIEAHVGGGGFGWRGRYGLVVLGWPKMNRMIFLLFK
jgi:hypothetical protein